jgi:hypothetical protein
MKHTSLTERLVEVFKSAMTDPDEVCLPKFRSLLSSLDRPSREEVGRLLGETAVGRLGDWAPWRNAAGFLLDNLLNPWPQDHRHVLAGLKDVFLQELGDEANLIRWTTWGSDPSGPPWHEGPGVAVWLYRILLTVATDDELREPLERLMRSRDPKLPKKLRMAHELAEGMRLASSRQITKAEAVRQHASAFRKLRSSDGDASHE